ncbi:MAG: hypothetical protein IIW18_01465 [Oscillospiraceae bacterium]|nr:hypothetical protein [Oscillospiraceae bacterium]
MKKIALVLLCVLTLTACTNTEQKEETVYDFSGEHELFTLSEGSIILDGEKQTFNGGRLTITRPEVFGEIASYSTSFYSLENGEREEFYSTTTTPVEGDFSLTDRAFGMASTTGSMINPEQGLWFELKTVDENGAENIYQIELAVTERK